MLKGYGKYAWGHPATVVLKLSVDGSSGVAVVQVLECAQISLREQRPVTLAEVTQRQGAGRPAPDAALAGTSVG